MSVSLDDIWSEPLMDEPSQPPPQTGLGDDDDDEDDVFRPTKRRRSTLFLGGSDDEDEVPSRKDVPPTSSARPDIDSLFEDLEGPSVSRSSKPFDLAARRREAQARAEKEAPSSSFPQYAVQSSSPPRDAFGGDKDGAGTRRDEDAGAGKKRKIAKLDEDRLLGKDGLPALVQVCKDFKPRGKGHELADLNRLFSLYQFWSHKMYPRTQFSDTVNRVEKLCHSKRMISALSGWRDQVHGTINGKKIPEDDIDMRSDNGDESGDEQRRERIEEDVFGPRRDNTASSANGTSSSRASSEAAPDSPISRPPSSASEHNDDMAMPMDDDDPFDFDELLRQEEEMRLAQAAAPKTAASVAVKAKGGTAGRDFTFDEDEEEMWAELHAGGFEDTSAPAPTVATNNSKSNTSTGYEEDPWDILDEIENEQQQAKAKPTTSTSTAPQEPAVSPPPGQGSTPTASAGTTESETTRVTDPVVVTPAKSVSSNDDDWDDMYV